VIDGDDDQVGVTDSIINAVRKPGHRCFPDVPVRNGVTARVFQDTLEDGVDNSRKPQPKSRFGYLVISNGFVQFGLGNRPKFEYPLHDL
jgi:hypothetical protein